MKASKPINVLVSYATSPIASCDLGPIFPISLRNYIRYVKYRARHPVTFHKYVLGLERHKNHGPSWISRVQNHPDAMAVFKIVDGRLPLFKANYRGPLSRQGTPKKKETGRKGVIKANAIMVNNNGKIGYKVIIDSDGEKEDAKVDNNEGFSDYEGEITEINDNEDGITDSNEGFSDYEDELTEDQRIEDLLPYKATVWIKNKYLN